MRKAASVYLVMELVPGGSVAERLVQGSRLDWHEATRILIEACRGLSAAHAAGLIHRDVKPGNILLPAAGQAKLAELRPGPGVRSDRDAVQRRRQYSRTPDYMSPEQCLGEDVDAATDLYALGATYCHC